MKTTSRNLNRRRVKIAESRAINPKHQEKFLSRAKKFQLALKRMVDTARQPA